MSTESVMPSNHLTLYCHLLLPSIFPSISVFSNESALHIRWPKDWSFSFSISPSSEYSGLISFRMDCFDLLAVQGTLESLLQYHSLKASILWCSAFLMVQLSHPYVTTGKTIALTIWTFVSIKVFSNVSVLCIRLPKYWSLSFSISPSSEYSGLISFRMDRCDCVYWSRMSSFMKSIQVFHSFSISLSSCYS